MLLQNATVTHEYLTQIDSKATSVSHSLYYYLWLQSPLQYCDIITVESGLVNISKISHHKPPPLKWITNTLFSISHSMLWTFNLDFCIALSLSSHTLIMIKWTLLWPTSFTLAMHDFNLLNTSTTWRFLHQNNDTTHYYLSEWPKSFKTIKLLSNIPFLGWVEQFE